MEFTATATINSLYWITSLHENEAGVSRRVLEDLEPICRELELPFRSYSPQSAKDLLAALDQIAENTRAGARPLVHLDLHGCAKDGILVAATGESVGWPELADKFRTINVASQNNLCVVSGACFSFQVVGEIDINKVVPFFVLLAPEQEISAGDIEERTVGFYKAMLSKVDILAAKSEWFPDQVRVFHCEEMLAVVLAKYINQAGIGRQLERRKEELVTTAIQDGVPNTRTNRRLLRKRAKKLITPTEDLIQRYRPTFLAGKQPGFTIAQLKKLVVEARAEGIKPNGPYTEAVKKL